MGWLASGSAMPRKNTFFSKQLANSEKSRYLVLSVGRDVNFPKEPMPNYFEVSSPRNLLFEVVTEVSGAKYTCYVVAQSFADAGRKVLSSSLPPETDQSHSVKITFKSDEVMI